MCGFLLHSPTTHDDHIFGVVMMLDGEQLLLGYSALLTPWSYRSSGTSSLFIGCASPFATGSNQVVTVSRSETNILLRMAACASKQFKGTLISFIGILILTPDTLLLRELSTLPDLTVTLTLILILLIPFAPSQLLQPHLLSLPLRHASSLFLLLLASTTSCP